MMILCMYCIVMIECLLNKEGLRYRYNVDVQHQAI